jgi:cytidylate kinase
MARDIIIAIDGYSSCGKSTLARDLASSLHYLHVDSGAMYRAVTLYFLRNQIPPDDLAKVESALRSIDINFKRDNTHALTLLNDEIVEEEIRSFEVNRLVSPVAAISSVRRFLVSQQRKLGEQGSGLVMDGRDIGTVVFPAAALKIFLTAAKEIRVERRYAELITDGVFTTREEVAESLAYRDFIDTTREDSPLRQADDAIVIDNSFLTREEQLRIVYQLAKDKIDSHS